jgi:hypothetical protein
MDLRFNSNPRRKSMQNYLWQGIVHPAYPPSETRTSKFVFILWRGHHSAGDPLHMFACIRKLTPQKLRLNLHGLLKVGGMD